MTILFRAEARGLFGYAMTIPHVGIADAEDLVQTVFHAAYLSWGKLRPLDHEGRRRWLYRVLRNKAVDQWRATRVALPLAEPLEMIGPGCADDVPARALDAMALRACWEQIERMPRTRRQVAYLKWGEGCTTKEIAELLGIAQATVRVHLKVARDELSESYGTDLSPGGPDGDGEEWEQ